MHYVYILQSISHPDRFYVGLTTDMKKRFSEHNSGKSIHTNKFRPWKIRTYMGFEDIHKAENFEKYLKTASGRAFAKKKFLDLNWPPPPHQTFFDAYPAIQNPIFGY